MRIRTIALVALVGCGPEATNTQTTTPQPLPSATATATTASTTPAPTAQGDEASARALLMKFLAPGADHAALTKPLRPSNADCAALFDAPTAAKLCPQYDHYWEKDPMVIEPKEGQTELGLWAATTEELRASTGNTSEFAGGWAKIAPHLQPHQTWYRFKFAKPGDSLGMSYEGLTFVNGHWVITPKPWRGL